MANDWHTQGQEQGQERDRGQDTAAEFSQQDRPKHQGAGDAIDGLADKKPEDLTPDELRLMADTMPGDGPGDD